MTASRPLPAIGPRLLPKPHGQTVLEGVALTNNVEFRRLDMRKRTALAGGAAAVALAAGGYGAATWYRYGRASRHGNGDELLDRFMPTFDVREHHRVRVRAPTEVTYASARELDLRRSPLIRGLFRARQRFMGGRSAPASSEGSFLDEVQALGWRVLAEDPGRELVMGAVTQPWLADVVFRGVEPQAFATFREPNYVKIAWTIGVAPRADGGSVFRTETRAVATDPAARARFRRYWTLASPGIVLMRWEMLRLVRRAAERRVHGPWAGSRAGADLAAT